MCIFFFIAINLIEMKTKGRNKEVTFQNGGLSSMGQS